MHLALVPTLVTLRRGIALIPDAHGAPSSLEQHLRAINSINIASRSRDSKESRFDCNYPGCLTGVCVRTGRPLKVTSKGHFIVENSAMGSTPDLWELHCLSCLRWSAVIFLGNRADFPPFLLQGVRSMLGVGRGEEGVVVVSHGSDSPVTVDESVNLFSTLIGHLRMTVKAGSQFWGFT